MLTRIETDSRNQDFDAALATAIVVDRAIASARSRKELLFACLRVFEEFDLDDNGGHLIDALTTMAPSDLPNPTPEDLWALLRIIRENKILNAEPTKEATTHARNAADHIYTMARMITGAADKSDENEMLKFAAHIRRNKDKN